MKKILVIRNVKNLIIMVEKTKITKKNSSWDILVIRRVKTTVGRGAVGTVIVHAYQHVTGLGDRSTRYLSFTALPSLSFYAFDIFS